MMIKKNIKSNNSSKSRLFLIYFLLASFTVLGLFTAWYLNHRVMRIYKRSVSENQEWVQKKTKYSELGELAGEVNAPGNDVFDSHNVEAESKRMQIALRAFNEHLLILNNDLQNEKKQLQITPIDKEIDSSLEEIEEVKTAMGELTVEAEQIFSYLGQNQPESAAHHIPDMNRKNALVNTEIFNLRNQITMIQNKLFETQWESAKNLERYEYALLGLTFLIIAGTSFYGYRLKLKFEADEASQKWIEEELRSNDLRLTEAQKIARLGSWEFDIAHDKVIWSDELYRIFGITPEEHDGTFEGYLKFIPPEDIELVKKTVELAKSQKKFSNYDHRIVRKNGEIGVVHATGVVTVDENGTPVKMSGTVQDITERKRVEEVLHESEERSRLLIEGVKDYAILMLDPEGRIVNWNEGAERIKGFSANEIVGQHFSRFYTSEDIQNGKPEMELKTAEAEGKYEEEGWRVRKDGSLFWANVLITALRDEAGKLRGFSKITRDITERKRVEEEILKARDEALEAARLKSEFLANMSHEIRTPMNGVIGMTGLLLDTNLDDEQRDFTETIRASADSLLTIINDILDFSKIEAGKLTFEKLDFDLRSVVESTVGLLAEKAQSKKIELASLVASNVPTQVRGDAGRLRQVLLNLTGNAVKFTEHGEVTVSATKESETATHINVRFAVRDTGIGIMEKARKGLFQAFVQADGSTTRKYGGTGLGLAISKQIVELMGGEIGIESEPGKGSTFWFVVRLEKQSAAVIAAATLAPRADLHNLRVLVVDDNATNRKILVHQTASWGMKTVEAESGAKAIELLRSSVQNGEPFNVALLDLMMPEMDGFELARIIKNDEQISAVNLVLMPSFGQRGDGQAAREIGISAYLMKPVKQSQLFDCLATVMGESKSADSSARVQNNLVTRYSLKENKFTKHTRILIAEDNPVNQKVAIRQVEKLGYRADVVSNGLEALDALSKASYDIVLMDCQMPEMDGYEATEEIRRREAATGGHLVIIAMTANALEGENKKCFAAGMDDYLSKPVNVEELQQTLARWQAASPNLDITEAAETSAVESDSPPVDISRLQEVLGDDKALFQEVVELYLQQMSENIEKLKTAVESGAPAEINRLAHTMLGGSATCGMDAVLAPLRELEYTDYSGCLNDAIKAIGRVESEFERIKIFLQNL